jgi:hypothetical protein
VKGQRFSHGLVNGPGDVEGCPHRVKSCANPTCAHQVIFARNMTSVPCSKVLSLNRSAPFSMTCAISDPKLLPPGVSPAVGSFEIGPIGKTHDGSVPKLKVTLKVNLHGIAAVTEVQAIEEVPEPVVALPAPMETDGACSTSTHTALCPSHARLMKDSCEGDGE